MTIVCNFTVFNPKYQAIECPSIEPIWKNDNDDNSDKLAEKFNQQVEFNTKILKRLLILCPCPIYKKRDFRETVSEFFYMDRIKDIGPYCKVLVIHHNSKYQGHIYIFHSPNKDTLYAIGIRGRYDKFIDSNAIPNISYHILESVRLYAFKNGYKNIAITYPRYNMINILEKCGFKLIQSYDLSYLQTPLIPDYEPNKNKNDMTDCFYIRSVDESIMQ